MQGVHGQHYAAVFPTLPFPSSAPPSPPSSGAAERGPVVVPFDITARGKDAVIYETQHTTHTHTSAQSRWAVVAPQGSFCSNTAVYMRCVCVCVCFDVIICTPSIPPFPHLPSSVRPSFVFFYISRPCFLCAFVCTVHICNTTRMYKGQRSTGSWWGLGSRCVSR